MTGATISINKARKNSYDFAKEAAILTISKMIKNLRIDPETYLYDLLKNSPDTRIKISNKLNNNLSYKYFPVDFDTSRCEVKLNFGSI